MSMPIIEFDFLMESRGNEDKKKSKEISCSLSEALLPFS